MQSTEKLRYTEAGQTYLQGRKPGESLSDSYARRSALCAFPRGRIAQTAKLQNAHMSKDARRIASSSYTALAAYRLIVVGAAETGAGGRHATFDPLRHAAVLGDTDTGSAVTRINPVHNETV